MNGLDALIAQARRQGWTVEERGSGHFMLRPPNRTDPLVVANRRGQLRRAGLRLDTRTTS